MHNVSVAWLSINLIPSTEPPAQVSEVKTQNFEVISLFLKQTDLSAKKLWLMI